MGRPKKYQTLDLYAPQRAYFKTKKGKEAVERYENSEARKIAKRDWKRRKRGSIVDKRQWFIDNYGEPKKVLAILNNEDQRSAIELYYGLTGSEPISQTAISKILKKSQSTISQILRDARKQLALLQQSASESSQELEEARSQS